MEILIIIKDHDMNKAVKITLTYILLPLLIIFLAVITVKSVMEPVEFNKEKAAREKVAIQQLKDIRDLQVAYKSVNGKFVSTFDSLQTFYNTGKMKVVMKVGSMDDSLAVANTKALKKKHPKITAAEMLEISKTGQRLGMENPSKATWTNIPLLPVTCIVVRCGDASHFQTRVTICFDALIVKVDSQLVVHS